MNRGVGILIIALALCVVGAQAGAEDSKENPPNVHPWTGTVKELRAVAARAADTAGDYLDEEHDWLYRRLQYSIEDVDTWFAERDIAPLVVPVSPMRIDFDSEWLHKQGGFSLTSKTSFDATLRVPNLERRFRLFLTNNSIQEDPVLDPAQQPNPVRAGLRFTPIAHVDLEFGVHAKIWPSVFGAMKWGRDWSAGSLRFYPFAKVYAETGSGLGVAAGLGVDRWSGRWVVRSASYADWVRDHSATDWTQTVIFGYARAVIQERRYDRLADGHDLACGVIVKLAASGDRTARATLFQASLLFKRPLHGGWLFGYAGPMVRWNRDFNWHPDAGVQIGFDALFWGLATPRGELADYCR